MSASARKKWKTHPLRMAASIALAVALGTAALAAQATTAATATAPAAAATATAPAAATTATAPAAAAARPAPRIDDVLTLAAALDSFRSVAMAPDGKRIAWVEGRRGADGRPSEQTEVFAVDLAGGPAGPRRVSAGSAETCATEPAWSPDGRRLAFLSDRSARRSTHDAARRAQPARHSSPGAGTTPDGAGAAAREGCAQLQLWVADLDRGQLAEITEITHLAGQLSEPAWSPDGSSLALLYIAGRTAAAGPLHAVPRDNGVVGETPEEQRLITVEPATGKVREVSPPDLHVYEFDWSPDGTAFAAVAASGSGDDNWWLARLYRFDRATGAATTLLRPALQIANPRWSPDGREIAFIGGLMSDQGATGGDVFAVAAAGGPARDLTPEMPASAASLSWTAGGKLLVFAIVDGASGLARIDPADGKIAWLWRQAAAFGGWGDDPGLALARDGSMAAAIVSSFEQPPEIWAGSVGAAGSSPGEIGTAGTGPGGSGPAQIGPAGTGPADVGLLVTLGWRQITHRNAGMRPAWGTAQSLHWPNDGGSGAQAVQGWLLAPPAGAGDGGSAGTATAATTAAGRRFPLVVLVHGGPASSAKPGWPRIAGALASQGFYVLMPNPRGSYGQGEAFTRANVKDFGYGDLRDILGGIDAAAAAAPIDPERTGIYGWSYGGYMTMWAVTQTQRFRAAVAGAGIVDWQSYYGQNRIDQWMIPYFGATVYDDPWVYARSSPISFIKAVRTPTLVLQGERDAEVPAPQAYEFWHALKTLGVETRLVIYPDEGHHLSPANSLDVLQRTVDWLHSHLR
jgi:dipeptidyl aminopeptidase/acylaminoacyl peptidase